ncbi:MAG: protein translocase subunit SecDF [Sphingobacteriales bacterium]|nr:MAG: protein translocase subunit SecDF [Sphingobacteriales bacterium]
MQLKGLVRFFAIALIVISLYQLHFTWVVNNHESKMEAKADKFVKANFPKADKLTADSVKKFRLRQLLDSTRDETVTYGVTGAISYQKAKEQELNLGLDLQGGMSATLKVGLDGLVRSLANNKQDEKLNKAIASALQRQANSDADFINLFAEEYQKLNVEKKPLAALFAGASQSKIKATDSDAQVIQKIRAQANDAVSQTYKVLQTRIDKFGVAQPSINLDKTKDIITVELPGVDNPERVRKYLQSTANLQFFEVYSYGDVYTALEKADLALSQYLKGNSATSTAATVDTTSQSIIKTLGIKTDSSTKAGADSTKKDSVQQSTDKPLLRYFAGIDPRYPYACQVALKDTATLNTYLRLDVVKNQLPGNLKLLYGNTDKSKEGKVLNYLMLYPIKTFNAAGDAELEGEHITEAGPGFDEKGRPDIVFDMDNVGANKWAEITDRNSPQKNNGVGRPVAIVLDNTVYSIPTVQNKITGGNSSITGSFTPEETQDLSNILKTGKLPAPAKIVQEQVVGPTLGKEAILGGTWAFAISFIVIFGLMLLYYNSSGWVANIALILNLLFTIGVLSALGATLTAPGIAALVLTIGMAVDTNVIIFERIKEELTHGKSYQLAVADGYRRSLPPVLDAHITSFLTAAILFYFGLGPVLGFATTQMLGIALSLFCGILISRLVTDLFTNKKKHLEYFTGVSKRIFKHAAFKFIEYRKIAYMISGVVLLLGVASFFNGFDEGVEFKGGRSYTVRFDNEMKNDVVRDELKKVFGEYPVIKTVGNPKTLNITTSYKKEDPSLTADSAVENTLYQGLKPFLRQGATYADFIKENKKASQTVQPTISDDLKRGAIKATIFALLIIFVYIFLRFRDWRYSLGTIIALFHDVFITLAVFSFARSIVPFPLEIDQHFIAAVLTVIGFSMNDTVIVFDRIREYSRTLHGADKKTIINRAINDTLSRTIMTSLTVFLTILILFLVGGEVTKGFAFAMLVGVVTGTYSSIFVAAPILIDMAKNKPLGEPEHDKTMAKARHSIG